MTSAVCASVAWREPRLRRRLGAMNNIKERAAGNGCLRVLGVDPAAAGPTGYGIVESDGQCCRVLHYGALKSVSKQQRGWSGAALQCVHALIGGLIEEFAPDAMAVESVFTALNMRTALRLAEVRGVVLLAAAQHGVEVHSYAPREVKATIAGHGHADKKQMQIMVRAILSMSATPEPRVPSPNRSHTCDIKPCMRGIGIKFGKGREKREIRSKLVLP